MRTTVYLDDRVRERLRQFIPARGLNRFVNEAVAEKVASLEAHAIAQEMKEGYLATRQDRAALAEDWDAVNPMDWPR